ncbi:MAG: type II toxin-antitoxin system HigB family toxin [Phormidesmis sp.]
MGFDERIAAAIESLAIIRFNDANLQFANIYRLISRVDYKYKKVFIRAVLTHAEYDKEDWKNDS